MVYFDNAATTFPKPEEVYIFMDEFYRKYGVNVGRGQYSLADKASFLVEETRELILDLFSCPQKQVVFCASATEALNTILRGIEWKDDYCVYVTPFEHNAVLRVLKYLQSIYRLQIRELAIDKESMTYDLEGIRYQFQENKPNVVIMTHASNVCGLITPIEEICRIAKKDNAICIVDMAQTAGLIPTNLNQIPVDYTVFSGHKTLYGPFGIAGFILNRNVSLKPFIYGGTGIESANPDMPIVIPDRFEAGSMNILSIAGLNAALKWIKKIGIARIRNQEVNNLRILLNVLREFDNINIIGRGDVNNHIGVVSCNFDGYSCDNIGQVLSQNNIAVRTGLHCAPLAHRFLGTFPAGTVRFSLGYFNSKSDFDQLYTALEIIYASS